MSPKKEAIESRSYPYRKEFLHLRWYQIKSTALLFLFVILQPFSIKHQFSSELKDMKSSSPREFFKALFGKPLFGSLVRVHAILYVFLLVLALLVLGQSKLSELLLISVIHWFFSISILFIVLVEGIPKHKKHIIPFLIAGIISSFAGWTLLLFLKATTAFPKSIFSIFFYFSPIGCALLGLTTSYIVILKKGKEFLRYIPFGALTMSLLPLVSLLFGDFAFGSSSAKLLDVSTFYVTMLLASLLFLQIPFWCAAQLWLWKHRYLNPIDASPLYFEFCWLPESYLATRLHQSLLQKDNGLEQMLWVLQFPTQRWAVRKALLLLWQESPDKVVELLECIHNDQRWRMEITNCDNAILGRSSKPITWEEVLLCELFDVQVDREMLRWYERIMFAPERWLRKSKTLYPACPTELKELALERVQPLMLQREQALQEYLEANPNSASS